MRIENINPSVHAITVVLVDEALCAADDADRRLVAGEEVGALHGVRCTIKEKVDPVGNPTPRGLVPLEYVASDVDAPQIARASRPRARSGSRARTSLSYPSVGLRRAVCAAPRSTHGTRPRRRGDRLAATPSPRQRG